MKGPPLAESTHRRLLTVASFDAAGRLSEQIWGRLGRPEALIPRVEVA